MRRKVKELVVGWLESSIGQLVEAHGGIGRFSSVLITSVDSSTDMIGIATGYRILDRYEGCSFVGTGLLVPGVRIAQMARELDLFNGFDEVWCFAEPPT